MKIKFEEDISERSDSWEQLVRPAIMNISFSQPNSHAILNMRSMHSAHVTFHGIFLFASSTQFFICKLFILRKLTSIKSKIPRYIYSSARPGELVIYETQFPTV